MSPKKHIIPGFIVIVLIALAYLVGTNIYDQKVDEINKLLTEDYAIQMITDLPDVQHWLAELEAHDTSGKPIIKINSTTDLIYSIHVYEDFPDHTATLGWYDVHMITGAITNELGERQN